MKITGSSSYVSRHKILEKIIEFTEEKALDFQSTRYPINIDDKTAQYIEADINIDLVILGERIEILYKVCEELLYIYDMLDNVRNAVDYDFLFLKDRDEMKTKMNKKVIVSILVIMDM